MNEDLIPSRDTILQVYAAEGATPAAALAGVSKRTVQRWAAQAEVTYEYKAPILYPCPSSWAYARGCRCDGCREANRDLQRSIKARRVQRLKNQEVHITHGVSGYSNWSCRCEVCRTAWSSYLRSRRQHGKSA